MTPTMILTIALILVIILFIVYAFFIERRHLEAQRDLYERETFLSESYENRISSKEEAFQKERKIWAEERAQYVLEMLEVYREKKNDEYYEKHISIPDTDEKIKKVVEDEAHHPNEGIYYNK